MLACVVLYTIQPVLSCTTIKLYITHTQHVLSYATASFPTLPLCPCPASLTPSSATPRYQALLTGGGLGGWRIGSAAAAVAWALECGPDQRPREYSGESTGESDGRRRGADPTGVQSGLAQRAAGERERGRARRGQVMSWDCGSQRTIVENACEINSVTRKTLEQNMERV